MPRVWSRGGDKGSCSYCGARFFADDEKREAHVQVDMTLNQTKRYVDEGELFRIKAAEQGEKRASRFVFLWFGLMALIIAGLILYFSLGATVAKNQGKISAGYYEDLIGADFKTVEAHLKTAGFKNIELLDLNDSGLAFWKNGKVVSISIGGNMDFEKHDYFDPETPVVISYH